MIFRTKPASAGPFREWGAWAAIGIWNCWGGVLTKGCEKCGALALFIDGDGADACRVCGHRNYPPVTDFEFDAAYRQCRGCYILILPPSQFCRSCRRRRGIGVNFRFRKKPEE